VVLRGVVAAWLVAGLVACGDATREKAFPREARRMPSLVEQPVAGAHLPSHPLSAVVAGPHGEVLALPVDGTEGSFVVLADGAPARFYGAPGEGPGELRIPQPLIVDDTAVVGYDLGTRRIMVFDRASGAVRREFRPRDRVVPYFRGPPGTVVATRTDRGVTLPALVDLATGRVREGIPPDDTTSIALFAGEADRPGYEGNVAVVGRWSGGTLVANGMTYRLVRYDATGQVAGRIDRGRAPRRLSAREVEQELGRLRGTPMGSTPERLEAARLRLARAPQRWFTHLSGPREDGRGRLWVMVEHGDSTVADVFAADTLLGSLRVDCPGYAGRWDLVGEWLVMLCTPADTTMLADAEVRRYRIVEPGQMAAPARER
jgi:hypothetical protein